MADAPRRPLLQRPRAERRDSSQPERADAGAAVGIPRQSRALGAPTRYTIVCLPSIEWSFRIQRPQQLARSFARDGHDVLFAKHSFGDALAARESNRGVEEIELPGTPGTNPYRDRLRDAGRKAHGRCVARASRRSAAPDASSASCSSRSGRALPMRLREAAGCDVVYDCMDLHAGFSSNTDAALADEQRLLETADLVVCSSQQLLEHALPHAKRTALVRNGVDYAHFARVPGRGSQPGEAALTIGYYGAIADWFDSELVAADRAPAAATGGSC